MKLFTASQCTKQNKIDFVLGEERGKARTAATLSQPILPLRWPLEAMRNNFQTCGVRVLQLY